MFKIYIGKYVIGIAYGNIGYYDYFYYHFKFKCIGKFCLFRGVEVDVFDIGYVDRGDRGV